MLGRDSKIVMEVGELYRVNRGSLEVCFMWRFAECEIESVKRSELSSKGLGR